MSILKWGFLIIFYCVCSFGNAEKSFCVKVFREAQEKYNQGDYQDAKELFCFVEKECNDNNFNISNWVSKCDSVLKIKYFESTFKEAQEKYNQGDYRNAKALFAFVGENCSDNFNVSNWISKCDSVLEIEYLKPIFKEAQETYKYDPRSAKELFSFVEKESSGNFNASMWMNMCDNALNPYVYCSEDFIHIGSRDTIVYVNFHSNVKFELRIDSRKGEIYSIDDKYFELNCFNYSKRLKIKISENKEKFPRVDYVYVKVDTEIKSEIIFDKKIILIQDEVEKLDAQDRPSKSIISPFILQPIRPFIIEK